jgi:hypothetical protein
MTIKTFVEVVFKNVVKDWKKQGDYESINLDSFWELEEYLETNHFLRALSCVF